MSLLRIGIRMILLVSFRNTMSEPEMPYVPGSVLRRRFERGSFFHYGIASEYYHPDTGLQLIYQFGGVYEGELEANTLRMRILNRVWAPNDSASHTGVRVGLTDYVRFSEGRDIEVVEIPDEPIPVLERAKEMLHRDDYNILTRNCEHYANYALRGTWQSEQAGFSVGRMLEGAGLIFRGFLKGRKRV